MSGNSHCHALAQLSIEMFAPWKEVWHKTWLQSSDRDKDIRVQQTLFCLNRHQEVTAIGCIFYVLLRNTCHFHSGKGRTTALCKMYFLLTEEELFASPTDYY